MHEFMNTIMYVSLSINLVTPFQMDINKKKPLLDEPGYVPAYIIFNVYTTTITCNFTSVSFVS